MEKSSLIHCSDSIYSFPVSENEIEIRLLSKKDDDINKIELMYNKKYFFHEKVYFKDILKAYSDNLYDYYVTRVVLDDLRFAYVFKITLNNNEVYYFSESGVTKTYDIKNGFYNFFQVSYINPIDIIKVNNKFKDRVFYQIFVDRFAKTEAHPNPRVNIEWGEKVDSKSIAGGSLKGIEEKIDYLKDLGVDALYLTPIFKSNSNHKYDVEDYYEISEDFGSKEDLISLVNKLHKNNIYIVLDMVFNHVSSSSKMFMDVILNGKESKYFDWFIIHGDSVDLKEKNYETFGECFYMPKLNLNNLEVQDYVLKICLYYVKTFRVDGFRLDVSDEIPHAFWRKLKETITDYDKDFILIGENWHNSQSFLNRGDELDSIMNYAFTKEMISFFAKGSVSPLEFKNNIISILNRYKTNVNCNLLNLLSSHDIYRFINECNFNEDRFILAYAFMFFYIGMPCIYYGDEFALEGGFDPDSRRCFIWDKDDKRNNYKVNNYIKNFIKIRKSQYFKDSEFNINEEDELIIVERQNKKYKLNLIINLSLLDKKIKIKGEILSSLNLENNKLAKNGFAITLEGEENE